MKAFNPLGGIVMKATSLLRRVLATAAVLVSAVAWAGFDPVMDDTDIFLTNPANSGQRPNVLIVLDTTANWSTYYEAEKTALVTVVNSLDESFNVGLMQFAGGSLEGTYMRFAVRQMTPENKAALATMVANLTNSPATNGSGDKTNNGVPGLTMSEAYAYFKGTTSPTIVRNADYELRTDYTGNTNNSLIETLGDNAFSTQPTSATNYRSPVVDGCQRNFIIYISNGAGSNQTGETSVAKNDLAAARSASADTLTSLPVSPSGFQTSSWMDEWTNYLANTGFTVNIGGTNKTVFVNTFALEIDPTTTGQGDDWTALLTNASRGVGKGEYYSSSGSSDTMAAKMAEQLRKIFDQIQAVNSVFASTTLPVSVNVRGTNLNQVYIGMFRPDGDKAPRWYGNLKMYNLKASESGSLYLADADGSAAENPSTGFITGSARSNWTTDSTFWSFRTGDENGVGGSSDNPDGDLVEKGAVAQKLRTALAASQASRNLYTCTTGCDACTIAGSGSNKTCGSGSSLSGTPFATTNTALTAASLGLGTKDVSPLTGKQTKTIAALTDRRAASISDYHPSDSVPISSFSNGGTTKTITVLKTATTKAITALSAAQTTTATISNVTKSTSGNGASTVNTFTVTTAAAHGFTTGMSITIAGNTTTQGGNTVTTAINGLRTITVPSGSTTTFTFQITGNNPSYGINGTASGTVNTKVARATIAAHGYDSGQSVIISGALPDAFNKSGGVNVTVIDANTITYLISTDNGGATTLGSATADTTTATATSPAHAFLVGDTVVVAGASNSGYNGSKTITAKDTDWFSYTVSSKLSANTASPVLATKGATTSVVVTTSSAHNLSDGNQVAISGADSCYNTGSSTLTYLSSTSFRYTTAAACAANTTTTATAAQGGNATNRWLAVAQKDHGFADGDAVTVEGSGTAFALGAYSGTDISTNATFLFSHWPWIVISNYCSYGTNTDCLILYNATNPVQTITNNSYTMRSTTNHRAYVTIVGHGYSTGDSITIAGADQAGYNGTKTITVLDNDTFYYSLTSALGPATTTSTLTASKNSTTAVATSTEHGFANNSTVDIAGATPDAFNGSKTITVIDANTFSYTLASAQGDASGTITAASGSGSDSELDALIAWTRGTDNAISPGGENNDGSLTDCRASVHGDVLHSRPAVINFNRYGGDNDVVVFYGSNDGVFRAIKGGLTNDADAPNDSPTPGQEIWGFVPSENFTQLKRLRNNSPVISSSFKKPYFMDGPIGVYTKDANNNGKLQTSDSGDAVYLYLAARRGGRYLYSMDVTDPATPEFRWKLSNSTGGFGELGYTFSQPTVVPDIEGYTNPVLIFGGGYDPTVEDIENCTITAASSTGVTYNKGTLTYTTTSCTVTNPAPTTVTRSMGRAIYVVDAITGELIWSAGRPGSGASLEVPGMDFAIPSDVLVVRNESGGKTNRAYVGDTGGNVWRIDFSGLNASDVAEPNKWKVTKLAAVGDLSAAASRRKFLFPPDVVAAQGQGHDQILIGSGDREHPFDVSVTNRFYMFKDRGNDSGPGSGTTYSHTDSNDDGTFDDADADSVLDVATDARATYALITHSASTGTAHNGHLYDATSNCIQQTCADTTSAAELTKLGNADGWFIDFGTGEKNIGSAVALNGVVFFNTNQPSQASDNCISNLGIARQYSMGVSDATATKDQNGDNTLTSSDRSTTHEGGGYLPSPVHVVVEVDNKIYEGVISGTSVEQPPGVSIGTRTRRFWYKEMD